MAISDWGLWACDWHQIERHGDDAAVAAAVRGDALLAECDLDGHRTWLEILHKIRRLTEVDVDEIRH